MFNIVNVNVEKVKESEVSMIPAPVIEFFNRYYGVDVSNVKIVYEDMDMELGYYNTGIRNTIHISNDVKGKGIKEEMVMVHEINHLLQNENNIGLSLNKDVMIKKFPYLELVDEFDMIYVRYIDNLQYDEEFNEPFTKEEFEMKDLYMEENYWDMHTEIDSRLAEVLYIYDQTGIEGMLLVVGHAFTCGLTQNLLERLYSMPNSMAKTVMIDKYNRMKKEQEEMIKQEHEKFEEELDDFVEELLAL